jgi:hypothetical protein
MFMLLLLEKRTHPRDAGASEGVVAAVGCQYRPNGR